VKAIIVKSPKEAMPMIEDAVQRLDVPAVPPKNIELTAYMLLGLESADAADEAPAELQSALKQLRATSPYKGFRLLDTVSLRGREGKQAVVRGTSTGKPAQSLPVYYTFSYRATRITADEKGRTVWFDGLHLELRQGNQGPTEITTDIDVREGQKVVVGRVSLDRPDSALFLVVTAKTVD
jgi:hypothetical protein